MDHIELAKWTELLLVAPASANLIAQLALGLAEDLVTTVALAYPAGSPRLLCPARIEHAVCAAGGARHCDNSRRRVDDHRAEAGTGCARRHGRFPRPAAIVARVAGSCGMNAGACAASNRGPTREHGDPVRYITNDRRTNGFAIALRGGGARASRDAVAGPVELATQRESKASSGQRARGARPVPSVSRRRCSFLAAAVAMATWRRLSGKWRKKDGSRARRSGMTATASSDGPKTRAQRSWWARARDRRLRARCARQDAAQEHRLRGAPRRVRYECSPFERDGDRSRRERACFCGSVEGRDRRGVACRPLDAANR